MNQNAKVIADVSPHPLSFLAAILKIIAGLVEKSICAL